MRELGLARTLLLALAFLGPPAAGDVDSDALAQEHATFEVAATLGEAVAIGSVRGPHGIELQSAGSNVNVVATLAGDGFARLSGRERSAPFEIVAMPDPDSQAGVGWTWSDGRIAAVVDPIVVLRYRCAPDEPQEIRAASIRADGREIAVRSGLNWDRAAVPDGLLAENGHAQDVSVRLCDHEFIPTMLRAAPSAKARLALGALFPWAPDGQTARWEIVSGDPRVTYRSWGPHDFVSGTPDDA